MRVLLALAALASVALSQDLPLAGTSVPVTLGDGARVTLEVQPGQDFEAAASKFCADRGISTDNAPKLVAALKDAYATRVQQSKPLFTLDVSLGGRVVKLPIHKGQDAKAAAEALLEQHKASSAPFAAQVIATVEAQVKERLAAPAAKPKGAVLAVVFVDAGGDSSHPLVMREGDTPEGAAAVFLNTHNLAPSNAPALVSAINRKLQRAASPPQLKVPVTIAGTEHVVPLYAGEDAVTAAREFVIVNDMQGQPAVAALVQGAVTKALAAQAAALTAEQQRKQQEAAQAAAQAAMDANKQAEAAAEAEPEFKEMRLSVAGFAYDVEFPVGEGADVLAEAFCEQEFDLLKPSMGEALKLDAVRLEDCATLVASLMQAQLAEA